MKTTVLDIPSNAEDEVALPYDGDRSFGGRDNIIMRVECLTSRETKVLLWTLQSTLILGLGYTIALFIIKLTKGQTLGADYFLLVEWVYIVNVTVASVGLALIVPSIVLLSVRGIQAILRRNRRSSRQRIIILQLALLLLALVDNVFFLVPSAKALAMYCWYYANFGQYELIYASMGIRWTCWNATFGIFVLEAHDLCPVVKSWVVRLRQHTRWRRPLEGKSNSIIMNANVLHHAPIYILWACFEALLLTAIIKGYYYRRADPASSIPTLEKRNAEDILRWYENEVRPGVNLSYVNGTEYIELSTVRDEPTLQSQVLAYVNLPNEVLAEAARQVEAMFPGDNVYYVTLESGGEEARVYSVWPAGILIDYVGVVDEWLWYANLSNYSTQEFERFRSDTFVRELTFWFQNEAKWRAIADAQDTPGGVLQDVWNDFHTFYVSRAFLSYSACTGTIDGLLAHSKAAELSDNFRTTVDLAPCRTEDECHSGVQCTDDPWTVAFNIGVGVMVFVYFVLYVFCLGQAHTFLSSVAYNRLRSVHIRWRFQVRMQCFGFLGVWVFLVLLSYVFMDTCNAQWSTIMGYAPMELLMSVMVSISAYMSTPLLLDDKGRLLKDKHLVPEAKLREFAWTCAELPQKVLQRGYPEVPMFCVELMLKLMYWCSTVYRSTAEELLPDFTTALAMFSLTHSKKIHHKDSDTHVIMGWSDTTVVVAFRGTASATNALTDAKAWRTIHPVVGHDKRQRLRRSRVHTGFYKAWKSVKSEVLGQLRSALTTMHDKHGTQIAQILVAGHSLGGALATLASLDVAAMVKEEGVDASMRVNQCCYTFGAPQVGNGVFAQNYDALVPDTWNVVNQDDAIPRMTNWLGMYSYVGQRVTFNGVGDMIVRPNWVEINVMKMPARASAKDHLLRAYAIAMGNAFVAQYAVDKSFPGGKGGVRCMWAGDEHTREIMRSRCEVDCEAPDGMTSSRRQHLIGRQGMECCLWCGCCGGGDNTTDLEAAQPSTHQPLEPDPQAVAQQVAEVHCSRQTTDSSGGNCNATVVGACQPQDTCQPAGPRFCPAQAANAINCGDELIPPCSDGSLDSQCRAPGHGCQGLLCNEV